MRPTTVDVAHLHIEEFLGVKYLGHRIAAECCQEICQLQDPLLSIEVMLIAILNTGGCASSSRKYLDQVFVLITTSARTES